MGTCLLSRNQCSSASHLNNKDDTSCSLSSLKRVRQNTLALPLTHWRSALLFCLCPSDIFRLSVGEWLSCFLWYLCILSCARLTAALDLTDEDSRFWAEGIQSDVRVLMFTGKWLGSPWLLVWWSFWWLRWACSWGCSWAWGRKTLLPPRTTSTQRLLWLLMLESVQKWGGKRTLTRRSRLWMCAGFTKCILVFSGTFWRKTVRPWMLPSLPCCVSAFWTLTAWASEEGSSLSSTTQPRVSVRHDFSTQLTEQKHNHPSALISAEQGGWKPSMRGRRRPWTPLKTCLATTPSSLVQVRAAGGFPGHEFTQCWSDWLWPGKLLQLLQHVSLLLEQSERDLKGINNPKSIKSRPSWMFHHA